MFTKKITLSSKGMALLCLLFIANFSFGQTCGDSSTSADVHLQNIQEVTVTGAATSAEAEDAYKQAMADAAEAGGLATCSGSCTVGDCTMTFGDYASGSGTPKSQTTDGTTVFDAPSNGDQKFSVKCPCIVKAKAVRLEIVYEGGDHQQHEHGNFNIENDQLSTSPQSSFVFFPNPTNDKITLRANLKSGDVPTTMRINSLHGQLILEADFGTLSKGQHNFNFETQDLNPGIYFASIYSNNEILARTRIVVQR